MGKNGKALLCKGLRRSWMKGRVMVSMCYAYYAYAMHEMSRHHARLAVRVFFTLRALLQREHDARRLSSSYHAPPIDTGKIWSTSCAMSVHPWPRIWQRLPSRSNTWSLTFFQGPEYWGLRAMDAGQFASAGPMLLDSLVLRVAYVLQKVRAAGGHCSPTERTNRPHVPAVLACVARECNTVRHSYLLAHREPCEVALSAPCAGRLAMYTEYPRIAATGML